MVIHAVDYSRKDGVFATSELNFFLGKNYLVTYHTGPIRSVALTRSAPSRHVHVARGRTAWPYAARFHRRDYKRRWTSCR